MTKNKKKGLPEITKKDLWMVFFAFFSVFMFVGYMRGRSVRYSPERLRADLLKSHKNDFKLVRDREWRMQIVYACPSNEYRYEIDGNVVHAMDFKDSLPEGTSPIEPAILSDKEIINSFLVGAGGAGGAASIWTVREVFAYVGESSGRGLTSSSKVKLVIYAVLGSLVGYEIGKSFALSRELTCDYVGYSNLLNSRDEWKPIERAMWWGEYERVKKLPSLGECGSTDEAVNQVQKTKLNDALTKLGQYEEGDVSVVGHDYSSSDFKALYDFEAVKNEYVKACGKTKD
ncbi:MAG: hypothetical protein JOZ96_18070 [Acidobacteria bacterium]|nr:hypothetical protein [Acidobacteriota bacterium]